MKKIIALVTVAALSIATPAVAHVVPDSWTNAEHVTRYPAPTPIVKNLRYASHPGFDRIVVDISGKAPGYDNRYVSGLYYCGTGNPVTGLASGRKFLKLDLTPAQAHTNAGANTYSGPVNRYIGLPTVKRIVKLCDYEGHVTFGLVLDAKEGFHTYTLYSPTRIVVDVNH